MTTKKVMIATPEQGYRLIGQSPGFAAELLRKQGYDVRSDMSGLVLEEFQKVNGVNSFVIDDFLLHVPLFQVDGYRTGYCTHRGEMVGRVHSLKDVSMISRDLDDAVYTYLSHMASREKAEGIELPLWAITTDDWAERVAVSFIGKGIRDFVVTLPKAAA